MSSSLLTPDLRRILDDLARRLGILERRTSRVATPSAPITGPHSHSGAGSSSVVVNHDGATGDATAVGTLSVGIGEGDAAGDRSVAIGDAQTEADYSIAILGWTHTASSIAIGHNSETVGASTVALGDGATVGSGGAHDNAMAFGKNAATTAAHQIMLGTAAETVVIPGDLELGGTITGGGTGGTGLFTGVWTWASVTTGYQTLNWATATYTAGIDRGSLVSIVSSAPVIATGKTVRVDINGQAGGTGWTFCYADVYGGPVDVSDKVAVHGQIIRGAQVVTTSSAATLAVDVEHDSGTPPFTLTLTVTEV